MPSVPQGYNGRFFAASISSAELGSYMSGLSNFSIQWQRPVGLYKSLDKGAPAIVNGKPEGQITMQGFATTDIATTFVSSATAFGASPQYPVTAVVTLNGAAGGSTYTKSYTAYNTGGGMTFRQVSDRMWVLDGIKTMEIIS